MKRSRICRICGDGYNSWSRKKCVCSDQCEEKALEKIKSCGPCKDEDQRFRAVIFSDKTKHIQRYCIKCLNSKFIPKKLKMDLIVTREEFSLPGGSLCLNG